MNSRKRYIVAGLCIMITFLCSLNVYPGGKIQEELYSLTYAGFKDVLADKIDGLLKKYQVPGLALALLHNGEPDLISGYGYAHKGNKIPVNPETLFQVASLSKSLTSWGVLKLVEKGELDLDVPVAQYLTRWQLPDSDFNKDGITVRRLLSHTAGIGPQAFKGYSPGSILPSLEDLLSGKGNSGPLRIVAEPGEKYIYSGNGYALLQLIIEEVTGQSYAQYMQQEILLPLGMKSSTFASSPALDPRLATAYDCLGRAVPDYKYTALSAAGLYTSVTDLARFVSYGLYKHHTTDSVLSRESVMLSFEPVKSNYALGFHNFSLTNNHPAISHGGDNRGWASGFMFIPDTGEGVLILTNSDNGQNLILDIINSWTQWNTGELQPYYNKIMNTRSYFISGAVILFVLMLLHLSYLIITFIRKKRVLFSGIKNHLPAKILRFSLPCIFCLAWWLLFYTGLFFDGWQPAPRLPYGFGFITAVITVWGFLFLGTAFFWKKAKPIHS